ncbi:hypothetical protein GCM10009105_10060 [Dokdonella soli]|uniref:Phospholipase/carboxylesterase/thioesterase domain-containing protein n=2 Tax=Dokdonella soli TaxID=529810 RepID=A0ABP3TMT0_9GAMM
MSAPALVGCDDLADGFDTAGLQAVVSGSSMLTTTDGQVHTWYYRIPPAAAPGHGRAVLIWLHGDGGSGNGYASGFYPYTDAVSAILVTPSGIGGTWTHAVDDLPGQPQDSQFLSALIDAMIADGIAGTPVDPDRIYIGGESRGAYMPYFLLQRPSTKFRFAAAAIMRACSIAKLAMSIAKQTFRARSIIPSRHRSCTCTVPTTPWSLRRRPRRSTIRSTGISTGTSSIR